MYVIDPTRCSHPAQLRGGDGKMRCIVCGAEVPPEPPEVPPEPPEVPPEPPGAKDRQDDK